jgi:osmotically-inducible protein OsmY
MANRESGDYRRNRHRDEEFRGSEFRGGAEEPGGRGQESGRSYNRDFEESGREMQFGREHEQSGRQEWQSGSQGYGSRGYGQSQRWEPQGRETRGGYSGESQGYGSPGYGYGSQPRYGSGGYESQGYGSQGYGYAGGSQYGRGRYGDRFGRGPEGIDRSRDFSIGQSHGARSGQEFSGGTSPYGGEYGSFRRTQGFGQTSGESGYSEGQFSVSGRTRGRYTGRGPKGYTRSDDRIKEDVSDRLEQHGEIDAWEIVVMVQNGEVTLEGTVPDRRTKRLAEDVAEESPGVKQVNNRLRIQGDGVERESGHNQLTSGQTGQSTSGQSSGTSGSTESDRSSRSGSTSKSSTRT